MKVFKVQHKVCSGRFWSSKIFKLIKTLFTILWHMHTNQQTIKKNYLNQIKEIFLASRVDNSRSLFFLYPCFPRSSKSFVFTTGYVWTYRLTKVLFLEFLIFSTHEITRVRWRQKNETLFLFFFSLIFDHLLTPRVFPLFIICLELISTIGSSVIFKY